MSAPLETAVLHVLRLSIEAATALSSSSGDSLALQDNVLARDANGLPILMGTTLAGVLRHLHPDYFHASVQDLNHLDHPTNRLFGIELPRRQEGRASRIEVSFGFVHDKTDQPVGGRRARADIERDDVLEFLTRPAPVRRDNVAIDGRGVAAEHKKFERVSVPAGTRFSLDLSLEGSREAIEDDKKTLLEAASLFRCPYLRIGGATRRGLGRVRLLDDRVSYAQFDRSTSAGWRAYAGWRAREFRDSDPVFRSIAVPALAVESVRRPVTGKLTLAFEGWWRFGQGERSIFPGGAKEADQRPVTEASIVYDGNGRGRIEGIEPDRLRILAAASGVKGALAHRAEFELNRMRQHWADEPLPNGGSRPLPKTEIDKLLSERGMDALLGSAKEKEEGEAGALFIDDAATMLAAADTAAHPGSLTHNSLDRFSQGVRNQILFTEESLWQGAVSFELCLLTRRWTEQTGKTTGWVPYGLAERQALARALEALVKGRLAVGADSGDGHGYCDARASRMDWTDQGAWLNEPEENVSAASGASP
jgi:CRISPR/Cas system CMR subunit Cmr4 (Cas7 group RAMP superfamily)